MESYVLPAGLVQAIVDNLNQQPFGDVAQLMGAISQTCREQEQAENAGPQPVDSGDEQD